MRSLEDRVAHLEKCLISHGICDYDQEPGTATTTEPVDLSGTSAQPFHTSASSPSNSSPAPGNLSSELIQRLLVPYLGQPAARDNNTGSLANHSPSEYEQLLNELPRGAELPMPTKESATKLIEAYFQHSDFFSPVLSREQFLRAVDTMYQDLAMGNRPHLRDEFRTRMVFAIAVRLLNRVDSSLPLSKSTAYFTTGARLLVTNQEIFGVETLEHLEALLLVVQYQSFESNLRGVWHFLGLATRLAVHLGLHTEQQQSTRDCLNNEELITRRRLFWATYTFERNICPVLSRPFSIPDEAIETSLPTVIPGNSEATQALATHLIKLRQLESEIYTTLHQKKPCNGAFLNHENWRLQMQQRLHQWYSETPPCDVESPLAPVSVFEGLLATSLVQLYYPSQHLPTLSNDDIGVLAQHATCSVTTYKDAFRTGTLRFYWRAAHNLFRAGSALLYCARTATERLSLSLNAVAIQGSIAQCSNILWGMAERYPNGKSYRDAFERLLTTDSTQDTSTDAIFDGGSADVDWLSAWVWDPASSLTSTSSVHGPL